MGTPSRRRGSHLPVVEPANPPTSPSLATYPSDIVAEILPGKSVRELPEQRQKVQER